MHRNPQSWQVEITFSETDRRTRADAVIETPGGRRHHGWGWSRRNPSDADVPEIGEEVAAARALAHLGQRLLGVAEDDIEVFEDHPVHLHV